VVKRSLEQFASKDHEFIGYSNSSATDEGFSTEMTGVLRAYRGGGVATLLKLYGIQHAQMHGNGRLFTVNDAVNTAVLALNQKLVHLGVSKTVNQ